MPKINIDVCAGTYCTMMGSMDIIASIESLIELNELSDSELVIRPVPCTNECDHGKLSPVVIIDGETITQADSETIMSIILQKVRAGQKS